MKIYIANLLPNTLISKMQNIIDLFGIPEEKIKYELSSKEFGTYIIDGNSISYIESTFEPEYEIIK
jgi:hypothetical protein